MVPRKVVPELLDHLSPRDPRSIRSRRDLIRVNAWMGNPAWVAKELMRDDKSPPMNILDLGSGDGLFWLRVVRRLRAHLPKCSVTLVDRQTLVTPETRQEFERLGWKVNPVCSDVFEFLERSLPFDWVTANLFLHHFEDETLSQLLGLISKTSPRFVACEPARTELALAGSRMLCLIGCNDVTRHDAVVSVRAGFRDRELSERWPDHGGWSITESTAGLFSHLFSARRAT
jgi:2-polyprenyl-3-methyl-5-hydroxy-6-metoxy-1,4-benzoquinol methylase